MSGHRVHLVVPCYNEAARFDSAAFARALAKNADFALVLVNDGSTDDTSATLHDLARRSPERVEVVDQPNNAGKAEAVRQGMLTAFASGAEMAGYWDADLATPLDALGDFVSDLDADADVDIVLGARVAMLGHEIQRSAIRHYAGRVFATLASVTIGLPVYDTQCGAKLFRCNAKTRALFDEPFGSRWVFDVELLARYLENGGSPSGIREQALARWTDIAGSKVKPSDFLGGIVELARIKRRYRRRRSG